MVFLAAGSSTSQVLLMYCSGSSQLTRRLDSCHHQVKSRVEKGVSEGGGGGKLLLLVVFCRAFLIPSVPHKLLVTQASWTPLHVCCCPPHCVCPVAVGVPCRKILFPVPAVARRSLFSRLLVAVEFYVSPLKVPAQVQLCSFVNSQRPKEPKDSLSFPSPWFLFPSDVRFFFPRFSHSPLRPSSLWFFVRAPFSKRCE